MTRNQVDTSIPWIVPWINLTTGERMELTLRAGGYGYGLAMIGRGRFLTNGSSMSLSAFGHIGNGGTCIWADPEHDVVGVFLSVSTRLHRGFFFANSDLFQNAVHAAIVD